MRRITRTAGAWLAFGAVSRDRLLRGWHSYSGTIPFQRTILLQEVLVWYLVLGNTETTGLVEDPIPNGNR